MLPPAPVVWLSRRDVLRAGIAGFPLAGCAGLIHGGSDPGVSHRSGPGTGLGIVIFEHVAQDFPFHTAAIINAPQGRALYDPGGWWGDDQGQRVRDVTHGLTPTREAAYLERDYFGADPEDWRLHRFDLALNPDQAALALRRTEAMPPVVFGLCCWALTTVLSDLDGFADLPVSVWPATLLADLRGREGLRHAVRLVPEAHS